MTRQTSSNGAGVLMPRSINPELTEINCELLHVEHLRGHHQLMVEGMAKRLKKLQKDSGLSLDTFGDIAGVSAQAVQKWMAGGDVKEAHLVKIAKYFKTEVAWIRYGIDASAARNVDGLSSLARAVAERWSTLSADRQEWFRDLIFTTSWMEQRFPAMRKGRPRGEHYDQLETAIEKDFRQL